MHEARHAADVRVLPDREEVVRRRAAGEVRAFSDEHVPREHHVVREDDVVTDLAVVRDVAARHQEATAPDACVAAALDRAAVDRDELADHVVVADLEARGFAAIRLVLRRAAEARLSDDEVVRADACVPVEHDLRPDACAVADAHVRTQDGVGTDLDVEP